MPWFALLIALLVAGSSSQAQQVLLTAQGQTAANTRSTITVRFKDTPLRTAVKAIAERSGVEIAYSPQSLPANVRVTYAGENVSAVAALEAITRNTGVQIYLGDAGRLKLVYEGSRSAAGVISGRVMDAKTGRGVSGANVSVDSDTRGVMSAEDGSYRIIGVGVGAHIVTVRLVGYAKQSRQVVVGEGVTVSVDFKLEPSANVLDQVVVTGTIVSTELRAVPNAITVITAKQIQERGITRIDQLFRGDIPGLYSVNLGSSALLDEVTMFSRGATALVSGFAGSATTEDGTNRIKTYIDGIEMADSKYLSQIDPSSIERIEILTGPQASTVYGSNAINGVMQIFTKRGNTSRPQLSVSFSSGVAQNNFSAHLAPNYLTDANVSAIEGRLSYNLGGSWNYIGSWTPSKQTQRFSVNGGGRMEFGNFSADLTARRGLTQNRQNGSQTQAVINRRATGVYLPTTTSLVTLPAPQTQTLLGQTIGFSLGFRPFSWWSHELGFGDDISTTETIKSAPGFSGLSDTTLVINPISTSRTSEHYTTTMQLSLASFTSLNVILGGDHWYNKGLVWSGGSSNSLTAVLRSPGVTRNKPSTNTGAFIQGQLGIKDALFFTYGVRSDWNPNFGDKARVLPGRYGVSFTHDIGSMSAKLRGSYGRSIRPPGYGQKLGVPGDQNLISIFGAFEETMANSDLTPEYQQGGEGGIELYFGSRSSLVVTRYNQTVDNLISLVGGNATSIGLPGLDSVRSLLPQPVPQGNCSSDFRDADGHCYRYQQKYLNVGSIRNQGWELQTSLNTGSLTTKGTYSWTKSRVLGSTPKYRSILTGFVFERGRPFDYVPEHTWALSTTYTYAGNSLSLSLNGIGMRYISQDILSLASSSSNRLLSSRPRMDLSGYRALASGYSTADLNALHRFSSRVDATFQVNNLTNYYPNDYFANYASIGRQSRAGVRIRFN